MNILIIIALVLWVGLLFVSAQASSRVPSREEGLTALAKYLEAKVDAIPEREESFQIQFSFEGREFIFLDVQEKGFSGTVCKGYLKLQTSSHLTLSFTDKPSKGVVRTEIFIASQISSKETQKEEKLHIPKELSEFGITSSNNAQANALFDADKIAKIFKEFKNIDPRGYPIMALRIFSGEIVLEFRGEGFFHPHLLTLYRDVPSIEAYLNQMVSVAKAIEAIPS